MAKRRKSPKADPGPLPQRGRIQAQSQYPADPCEKSVAWGTEEAPTKAEMLGMLDALWASLTDAEREIRQTCREQAVQFINNAPADGVAAPLSITFRNRTMRGGVRIDIEVHAGRACTG